MAGRRTRLHGPAAEPEDPRGGAVRRPRSSPGRRDQGGRRQAGPRRRLPGCRHRRVPLRRGGSPVLLHGGQCPAPGGASHHRGHDRCRPGEAADPHRQRWAPRGSAARDTGPRDRGAAQRRGSRPRLRPGTRAHRRAPAPGRAGHPGRHRRRRGRRHRRRVRLDDRQDHCPRCRSRRGAGEAAAGAGSHAGGHQERSDEQGLRRGTPRLRCVRRQRHRCRLGRPDGRRPRTRPGAWRRRGAARCRHRRGKRQVADRPARVHSVGGARPSDGGRDRRGDGRVALPRPQLLARCRQIGSQRVPPHRGRCGVRCGHRVAGTKR